MVYYVTQMLSRLPGSEGRSEGYERRLLRVAVVVSLHLESLLHEEISNISSKFQSSKSLLDKAAKMMLQNDVIGVKRSQAKKFEEVNL